MYLIDSKIRCTTKQLGHPVTNVDRKPRTPKPSAGIGTHLKREWDFIKPLPGVGIVWGFEASSVADAWRSDMERIVLRYRSIEHG